MKQQYEAIVGVQGRVEEGVPFRHVTGLEEKFYHFDYVICCIVLHKADQDCIPLKENTGICP